MDTRLMQSDGMSLMASWQMDNSTNAQHLTDEHLAEALHRQGTSTLVRIERQCLNCQRLTLPAQLGDRMVVHTDECAQHSSSGGFIVIGHHYFQAPQMDAARD